MRKKKGLRILLDVCLLLVLVAIDQISKFYAVTHFKEHPVTVIRHVLELCYVENHGAAFGILQHQKVLLVFISSVILLVIFYLIQKMPTSKKYAVIEFLFVCISAGAIGNMIDRIRLNYVIDFLYLSIISFPVFNFADICVTIPTIILVILFLFVMKEEDFAFLSLKEKKFRKLEADSRTSSGAKKRLKKSKHMNE